MSNIFPFNQQQIHAGCLVSTRHHTPHLDHGGEILGPSGVQGRREKLDVFLGSSGGHEAPNARLLFPFFQGQPCNPNRTRGGDAHVVGRWQFAGILRCMTIRVTMQPSGRGGATLPPYLLRENSHTTSLGFRGTLSIKGTAVIVVVKSCCTRVLKGFHTPNGRGSSNCPRGEHSMKRDNSRAPFGTGDDITRRSVAVALVTCPVSGSRGSYERQVSKRSLLLQQCCTHAACFQLRVVIGRERLRRLVRCRDSS